MSQPHSPSALPPARQAAPSSPVRELLKDVHARLAQGLPDAAPGARAEWGPDHEHSLHPSARQLRGGGQSFEWVAVAFPGWSLWHLHLGLVPRSPGVLALGVHWHDASAHLLPAVVTDLAATRAVTTSYHEGSGEHHADLLVVACSSFPSPHSVQVLADGALDLAHVLSPLLAVGPTAPPADQEPRS